MTRAYTRLIATSVALTGSAMMAVVLAAQAQMTREEGISGFSAGSVVLVLVGVVAVGFFAVLVYRFLRRRESRLASLAEQQGLYVDGLPASRVPVAIFAYAALSLFLELAVIRWQSAALSILSFYKNYSLLSAFVGLGLGYALSRRRPSHLFFVIPLLGSQLTFFWILRTSPFAGNLQTLRVNPFAEQVTMGLSQAQSPAELAAVYLMLGSVFLVTALAFIPVGQVVGRLMDRIGNLKAYGLNLLGSLAGVAIMYGLASLWTPPSLWFAIAFAALMPLLMLSRGVVTSSAAGALFVVGLIALPSNPAIQEIHSPYQLLEREYLPSGEMVVRASGHFLLNATDLRRESIVNDPFASALADYYEFPFRTAPSIDRVLVVGAGAGNDVAAALRLGAGHVDAVEIDPAVAALGRAGHPERPYDDPRVRLIVDDARSYLGATTETYDLVIYGLLDSHSVLSHGANVRLDSFVYTVEGLREARNRLGRNGVLSLAFYTFTPELSEKLYHMLTEAFDGEPPLVVSSGGQAVVYLHGVDGTPSVSTQQLSGSGLTDVSSVVAGRSLGTDAATDDWPFLYMARRVYPFSYLGMAALVVILSALLLRSFFREGLDIGNAGFFFLGAGFLLIETKGITELGLAFGNTWQVIGLVIAGILMMAYFANLVVAHVKAIRIGVVFLLLLGSMALGYIVSVTGGLESNGINKWLALLVLTLPVLFSGIAFSTGLKTAANLPGVMAANLSGATLGGLLEYNSMRFGFRSLYVVAAFLYLLAGVMLVRNARGARDKVSLEPATAPVTASQATS